MAIPGARAAAAEQFYADRGESPQGAGGTNALYDGSLTPDHVQFHAEQISGATSTTALTIAGMTLQNAESVINFMEVAEAQKGTVDEKAIEAYRDYLAANPE
jgi:hypothetical protein